MRNIKCVIAYDGSRYQGWQRQDNTANTIQQTLEQAMLASFQEDVELIASGRTDAGVHALGQVVNFKTSSTMAIKDIIGIINQNLPKDVLIKSGEEAPERFHARYHAKSKIYMYHVHNAPHPDPFTRKYAYLYPETLDMGKIRSGAELFLGTKDFMGFSSLKKSKKSTVRTIYSIDIENAGDEVTFLFHGDGFLFNMVRIMVGTLLEVGTGMKEISVIPQIFESKTRALAGFTAPPLGLFLKEVLY